MTDLGFGSHVISQRANQQIILNIGLPSAKPGSLEDCNKCSEELKIKFPADYLDFTLQIGPGTLGRVRIFG